MIILPFKIKAILGIGLTAACATASLLAQATPANYIPEIVEDIEALRGYNELVPYVLRSPHQGDSGTCLYMSLTGIAEWWLARLNPHVSRAPNGPLDLSERYLINASEDKRFSANVKDWRTDSIEVFNSTKQAALNSHYPFTKGWYKLNKDGDVFPAEPNSKGSLYGVNINWFDQLKTIQSGLIALPKFKREVIYADPEENEWNVGLNPRDIVQQVKDALKTKKAPIQVIYNHESVWHSVYIIGYDDDRTNRKCGFVESSIRYFGELVDEFTQDAAAADTEKEKKRLLKKAAIQKENQKKLSDSYWGAGGCRGKGVFYVRNSEFYGHEGNYSYYTSDEKDARPYAPSILLYEYEWLEHLANHIVQITVE
ncbi:MAG: hypothetical protein RJB13_2499 [Pseudomonadota bacterium]